MVRLVRWLREAEHDAWAVAPGGGGPEGTRHIGRWRSVRANRSKAPIALNPRVVSRTAAAVADADVVHLHEPFMPMVSLGALRATTPPKVGTFHADPGPMVRRVYRGMASPLRRLAARLAAATAVSPVAAAPVADLVDVTIVPNGIDVEDYRDDTTSREAGRVVFVGRDDERKGLDVLLQAWPVIRAAVPDAELRVVGADRRSGPERVAFLGRIDEDHKRRELRSASVMVAPNLGGESFGIVVLEGLAAGCAVVASDLESFRAVAGDAARYVAVGDPSALATAVTEALADPSALRGRAVERARRFDRTAVLAGYLDVYRRALEHPSGVG